MFLTALVLLFGAATAPAVPPARGCCPVVELRQYTLTPGVSDRFFNLFEDRFIESQEAVGIRVIGEFRQIGMPNKFYWFRGFRNMQDRAKALAAFYYGPVWRRYRGIANPMLLENDNILLLQPAHAGSGFARLRQRPPVGTRRPVSGLVVTTIYYLGATSGKTFDSLFEHRIRPAIEGDGAVVDATFVTNHAANTFPQLPIRSDANVFVSVSCFRDKAAYEKFATDLAADPRWWTIEGQFALSKLYIPPEVDMLTAAPRSSLNCAAASSIARRTRT